MATCYLRNTLYPDNPKLLTVDITEAASAGDGEHHWLISISATAAKDHSGEFLGGRVFNVTGTAGTLDEFISQSVLTYAQDIDWSEAGVFSLGEDRYPPYIFSRSPESGAENVPIASPILINLRELLPGAGIDLNSVSLKVNGVPVSPQLSGHPFNLTLTFQPRIVDS